MSDRLDPWWRRLSREALGRVRSVAIDVGAQRLRRLWLEVCWDLETGLPRQGIFLSRLEDLLRPAVPGLGVPVHGLMAVRLLPAVAGGRWRRTAEPPLRALSQELRMLDPAVVQHLSRLGEQELVWMVAGPVSLPACAADLTARLLRVASRQAVRSRLRVAALPLAAGCRGHERLRSLRAALDRNIGHLGEPVTVDLELPAVPRAGGRRHGVRIARAWGAVERPVVDAEGLLAYFDCEPAAHWPLPAPTWATGRGVASAPSDLHLLALALQGVRADGRVRQVQLDLAQWQRRAYLTTLRHWMAAAGEERRSLRIGIQAADAQRHPASLRAVAELLRDAGAPLGLVRLGHSPGQFDLLQTFRPGFVEFDRMLTAGLRQPVARHAELLRECVWQVHKQGVRSVVFRVQTTADAAALERLQLGVLRAQG